MNRDQSLPISSTLNNLIDFYPRALREEHGSSDGHFLLLFLLLFSFSFSTPLTFCSYPAEKSSSFVPTRPKKAQVLFLPGRKKLKFCSYPAEKSSSFVPTRPRKAQVFVSLRYRKRCEVGRRVGPSLSMRSCFILSNFRPRSDPGQRYLN